jgi:hypothetical protein
MELCLLVQRAQGLGTSAKHPSAEDAGLLRPDFPIRSPPITIHLNEIDWYLTLPLTLSKDQPAPSFACISYLWGLGRVPNPIHIDHEMSDQTLTALSLAMRASTCTAFWIDAICVPVSQPGRTATLGSMGYIYSLAAEVVVTLRTFDFPIIREFESADRFSDRALRELENDEWVSSVWTYQEVVNSNGHKFVFTDPTGTLVVPGDKFLNRVGYSLHHHRKAHSLTAFDQRESLPHLDALEDTIADWFTAGYTNRSALQVISKINRREIARPENNLYAIIGGLSQEMQDRESHMGIVDLRRLAEMLIDICERNGDYSFIYTANPRSIEKGWYPTPEPFRAIVSWHSAGYGQSGHTDDAGFWLHGMVSPTILYFVSSTARRHTYEWLYECRVRINDPNSNEGLARASLHVLRQMGFTGSEKYIQTIDGFFFPQTAIADGEKVELLIATQLFWTFGSPGLARMPSPRSSTYTPGVFVGRFDPQRARNVLI